MTIENLLDSTFVLPPAIMNVKTKEEWNAKLQYKWTMSSASCGIIC